jgi:hypothetical protein
MARAPLPRASAQARAASPPGALDSFDLDFSKKVNRDELVTGSFNAQREDVLFLGREQAKAALLSPSVAPDSPTPSRRPQAARRTSPTGSSAEELPGGAPEVPPSIIDGPGIRERADNSAGDALLIVHRYERVCGLQTSNRPVHNSGKLLGGTAAVHSLSRPRPRAHLRQAAGEAGAGRYTHR